MAGDYNTIQGNLSIAASQSVRRNAAYTDWEAFTPSGGSSVWGAITGTLSAGTGGATPIIGSIYLPTYDLFECDVTDGEHPIILAQNEGIVIRATVPATGVWTAGFTIKWCELAAF
jgi:hypothetical protein